MKTKTIPSQGSNNETNASIPEGKQEINPPSSTTSAQFLTVPRDALTSVDYFNLLPEDVVANELLPFLGFPSLIALRRTNKQNNQRVAKNFPKTKVKAGYDNIFYFYKDCLWVVGANSSGQLGLGHTQDQFSFVEVKSLRVHGDIVEIQVGPGYTLIRFANGKVFATGRNTSGQLGLGHTQDQSSFFEVSVPQDQGAIVEIKAGFDHTLIRYANGKVFAAGRNASGQLGLEDIQDQSSFVEVPVPQNQGAIVEIQAGFDRTLIRYANGKVFAAGRNTSGQLGLGHTQDQFSFFEVPVPQDQGAITKIQAGFEHTFIVFANSKVFATGRNNFGQLGLGHTQNQFSFEEVPVPQGQGAIAEIQAGTDYTLIRFANGKVFAIGRNNYGQLGLGHTQDQFSFEEVPVPRGQGAIAKIQAGFYHTLIHFVNGKVFAAGLNDCGQLGPGYTQNHSSFVEVTAPGKRPPFPPSATDDFLTVLSRGNTKVQGLHDNAWSTEGRQFFGRSLPATIQQLRALVPASYLNSLATKDELSKQAKIIAILKVLFASKEIFSPTRKASTQNTYEEWIALGLKALQISENKFKERHIKSRSDIRHPTRFTPGL